MLYYTSPDNFRAEIDALEKIASELGSNSVKVVTHRVFNSEGTAGFKQHMLEADDDGRTVEIVIKEDNHVEIRSPSGTSSTGTESQRVKKGGN